NCRAPFLCALKHSFKGLITRGARDKCLRGVVPCSPRAPLSVGGSLPPPALIPVPHRRPGSVEQLFAVKGTVAGRALLVPGSERSWSINEGGRIPSHRRRR